MSGTRELPDPRVGTVVAGRYRIERRLAAGGMGVVYEATQQPLGRRVALKVIRGDSVDDEVARMRFEREAKTASSIQDPHVVVVHDFGALEGEQGLFLAMEFVDGETLRSRLANEGRITWRRTLTVIDHVARALAAAHSKGLVHRDLKPENIMLVPASGEGAGAFSCKVLDFGLAKGIDDPLLAASDGKRLTRSGGFVGTPGYISPEHIDGAGEDPRQDVYALGVVWWEMLTGRHPFPAETPMKTLLRQMHEEAPPLDDVLRLADGIPPAGAQLVREMMARSPSQRPRDGAAVLARLQALNEAPGTETGKLVVRSEAPIDSSAPTLQSARPPLIDVPMIVSPHQEHRSSGVQTISERRTTPQKETEASAASAPPPSSPPPVVVNSLTGSTPLPRPRAVQRRLVVLLVACSLVGTTAGAVIIKILDETAEVVNPPPAPEPVPVVDAGVIVMNTDIVIEGLHTFGAVSKMRALVGRPTRLRHFRADQTLLNVDGDVASEIADQLDGKALDGLTVTVRELDRGRVVVVVVAGVVDAGVADVDAGVAAVDGDAGVATAPGGLEP